MVLTSARYEHPAELFIPSGCQFMTHWLVRPGDKALVGVEAFFTGHLSILLVYSHGTLIGYSSKFLYSKGKVVPYEQSTGAAERCETWEGGGFIFHLAIHIPILKFSKIPFALFVGTSNLHSV